METEGRGWSAAASMSWTLKLLVHVGFQVQNYKHMLAQAAAWLVGHASSESINARFKKLLQVYSEVPDSDTPHIHIYATYIHIG